MMHNKNLTILIEKHNYSIIDNIGNMKQIVMLVPDQVHKAIKRKSVEQETSMVAVVLTALYNDKVISKSEFSRWKSNSI